MNAHTNATMNGTVALQRSLSEVVAEYDAKLAALVTELAAFRQAGDNLKAASCIAGVYGDVTINIGNVRSEELQTCLLKSAWKHVYEGLNIERLASPTDKRLWKQALEKPEPFTLGNIRGTFGKFIQDPRGNILRGLAEVFCGLDQSFKSHDQVKIGVRGLPKRVVLSNVSEYSSSYGWQKVQSVINALAAYQGKPLVTYREMGALMSNETALLVSGELPAARYEPAVSITGRGIRLKRYQNGNGHLYFEPGELTDINRALAEFYGAVLPDTPDENPQRKQSTAVSKDLQYYPTPVGLAESIVADIYHVEGSRVLEPSCGCGRLLDALRGKGAKAYGVEVDPQRAAQARAKGHTVLLANFLETEPTGDFDHVVMNSPFYGKHYAKHVLHAFKFLKPGGTLSAILPVTAREHGLLDAIIPKSKFSWEGPSRCWSDLPVGSFSESGTNINTVVFKVRKQDNV
jgi:SAM-dependent methyltransferase